MKTEYRNLNKNKTWKLVSKPVNKSLLTNKFIKRKLMEHKRLVARGFQQKDEIHNTYSLVIKAQTLKILLAYCYQKDFTMEQTDVETTF